MSEKFDAYYKWLGIPPKDQPPHHYKLLGIELYEDNPEVIEASAERQATYLHEVSAGPNVKESQKLLNEIAAARLCLLDPEKKASYDEELESKLTVNVSVDALSSGGGGMDDLPWDNLENLMTSDPAGSTSTHAQATSDTLPLPQQNPSSSGVFQGAQGQLSQGQLPQGQMSHGAMAHPQSTPASTSGSSRKVVLWSAIGGGTALVAIVAIVLAVTLSGSGDSNVTETPAEARPTTEDPPESKPKGGQGRKNKKPQNDEQRPNGDELKTDQPKKKDPPTVVNDGQKGEPKDNTGDGQSQVTKNPDPPKGDRDPPKGDEPKATLVQGPIRTQGFEPTRPTNIVSIAGSKFEIADDSTVLAEGPSRTDAFTIRLNTEIPNITAIRLEALPHGNIPARGPGRGKGGRFEITEISLRSAPLDGKQSATRAVFSGLASNESPNAIDKMIDGNPNSFWPVSRGGQPTTLMMYFERPLGNDSGTQLELELHQRFTLAHFRVSVSNDPSLLGKRMETTAKLPLFVNVGGQSVEHDGVFWTASRPWNGSFGHQGGSPLIGKSPKNPLYSCVSGIEAYRVRVPNGRYNVALWFSGRWPGNVGSRAFAVAIEGGKAQDIAKIPNVGSGPHKAAPLYAQVEVADGVLDVQFTKKQGDTVLNGIVVQKVP